jgi:plastocyanin
MSQRQALPPVIDRPVSRRRTLLSPLHTGALALLVLASASAFAASVYRVAQKGRSFSLPEVTIAQGDTVQFTNDDEFLHQIYVDSTTISFDSAEQPPGQTIEVKFPVRGTFPVRCHIHPKMLLTVQVR